MFKYDEADLPEVKPHSQWELKDGTTNYLYQVGAWSFDYSPGDPEVTAEGARKDVLAMIAWYNFLVGQERS